MTEHEVEEHIAHIDQDRRRRAWGVIALGVILGVVTGVAAFALYSADTAHDDVKEIKADGVSRENRVDSLESALNAQRAQFEACKDQKATEPGCSEPVAPPAGDIGPQGLQGLQGLPGPAGKNGSNGANGSNGQDGSNGAAGANGNIGTSGTNGEPGKDGEPGSPGADGKAGTDGTPGAQGPAGPAGPEGPTGPAGADGTNAPKIVNIFFGDDPSACVLVFVFDNGEQIPVDAPAVFCTALGQND